MDRRTPVIVGVGQVNGGVGAAEPVDLIATAVERAIADGGAARIPVDRIGLTKIGTKQYRNAPKRVAERAGFEEARTLQCNHGGHTVQILLAYFAAEIAQGRSEACLIAGGELGSALRSGHLRSDTGTPASGDAELEADVPDPDEALGDDLYQWIGHPQELALGIHEPIQMYPLMDTALGAALGRTREEHVDAVSRLWARFSQVAAKNPYADDRRGYTAEELASAGPKNRHVGYPYTKLMNSNQFVDQAAAILICSAGVAMDLGISRDRWVFPWASVSAFEPFVSERWFLHESRALAIAGRQLEKMVGRSLQESELIDLYACFPFAVQAQARALGLAPDSELTLTGGMRFAGGPWNNYTTHMLANLVGRVREEPEAMAVCSANGGLATRFCVTAYSGRPSPGGFHHLPSAFVDPGRRRRLEVAPAGVGHIEAYTIPHDRSNQATHAIAACRLADGARAWARLGDPEDVREMLAEDPIGRAVRFLDGGARLESRGGSMAGRAVESWD